MFSPGPKGHFVGLGRCPQWAIRSCCPWYAKQWVWWQSFLEIPTLCQAHTSPASTEALQGWRCSLSFTGEEAKAQESAEGLWSPSVPPGLGVPRPLKDPSRQSPTGCHSAGGLMARWSPLSRLSGLLSSASLPHTWFSLQLGLDAASLVSPVLSALQLLSRG